MRHYCHIHGEYSEYADGCPDCQEAEDRAEERAREAEERAREAEDRAEERAEQIIYKRANPGDYKCPACKYITLLRDASRCPICHGTIEVRYWDDLRLAEARAAEAARAASAAKAAAEAAAKSAAEAEWKRAEPERLAAAARARAEEAKKRAAKRILWVGGIVCAIVSVIVLESNLPVSRWHGEREDPLYALTYALKKNLRELQGVSGQPGTTITIVAPVGGQFAKVTGRCHWLTTGLCQGNDRVVREVFSTPDGGRAVGA